MEGQYALANIKGESILCRIEKINSNDITVSDGNHLYDVKFKDLDYVTFKDEVKSESKIETVNHPDHYLPGDYEAIKVIEAWMGKEACCNFCIANTLKYLARIDKKKDSSLNKEAKTIEDIKKASWYLNYALELKIKKDEEN